ncbi:MAG: DEAD/DEAH box helicase, partial [Aestuariivirgaceae bacterium]
LNEDAIKPAPATTRALILAPTRELALQIADSIKIYGHHFNLRHTVVMGGVSQRAQVDALRRGVDILVATPGRLLDLINQRRLKLSECEYLIIDEADRMLDMGFIRDVRKIVDLLPEDRQTMLFSATMPGEVAKLAAEILYEPERVEIAAKTVAVEKIEQRVHYVAKRDKKDFLVKLFNDADLSKVIVFTRTKRGADQVVKRLAKANIKAAAIHGNKSQSNRQRALKDFQDGRKRVLVATDIASRGIDIDHVTHVINYELPNEPESYVHRIGRTARAGTSGIAISMCDVEERSQLKAIEKLIKRPLTAVGEVPADFAKPLQPRGKQPARKRPPRKRNWSRRNRQTTKRAA